MLQVRRLGDPGIEAVPAAAAVYREGTLQPDILAADQLGKQYHIAQVRCRQAEHLEVFQIIGNLRDVISIRFIIGSSPLYIPSVFAYNLIIDGLAHPDKAGKPTLRADFCSSFIQRREATSALRTCLPCAFLFFSKIMQFEVGQGHAGIFLEHLTEIAPVLIPEILGDLLNLPAADQHRLGLLHLLIHHILLKRNPLHLLEQIGEIPLAEVNLLRHLLQRQPRIQMAIDISGGLADNPRGLQGTGLRNQRTGLPAQPGQQVPDILLGRSRTVPGVA